MKNVIMAEFSDVRYDARVLKEAKAISELGYSIDLLMYNTSLEKNRIYHEGSITYHIYSFKSRLSNETTFQIIKKYLRALFVLISINLWVLFHKADVYHAHNLRFIFGFFLSSIIHNSKFVYDAHEIHSEHYDNKKFTGKLKNTINEIIERIILKRCDVFIQASSERADYVSGKYKISKPYVINNYVPLRKYKFSNRLRKELGLNSEFPIMFYSGGIYLGGGRRLDNVLAAMKNIEDIYFVIVGFMNKTVKNRLFQILDENDLKNRVFILPPANHDLLFEYSVSADFGIIPLAGESLNTKLSALNKVSEYLMSGLPILCSNYENLKAIVNNNPIGKVGYTFNVFDIDSINGAIKKMINNKDDIQQLKRNALLLAKEYYNWENEKIVLQEIYLKF